MPFAELTNSDLIEELSDNSKRVREEIYENSTFSNCLKTVTTSDLFDKLNFNYRTVNYFNNKLSYPVKAGELSFSSEYT